MLREQDSVKFKPLTSGTRLRFPTVNLEVWALNLSSTLRGGLCQKLIPAPKSAIPHLPIHNMISGSLLRRAVRSEGSGVLRTAKDYNAIASFGPKLGILSTVRRQAFWCLLAGLLLGDG